jgi:uncharacterized repeat protein (TIGR01451 family)
VKVAAEPTGTITGSDVNGDAFTTRTSTATFTVTDPKLSIVKTASRSAIVPGQDVTYTVTVTNSGDTTLLAGNVADTWDGARLGFVSSTPATVPVSNAATFSVANLAPGASYPITLVLRATTTTGAAGNSAVVNAVDVNGDPFAPKSANATVVVGAPVLSVTKTRTSGPIISAGEDVTWRINVTNSGDATAAPLTVVDTWTAGALTYVSATLAPDATSSAGATWTVPTLAAGASTSIDVTMRATGTTGIAQNSARVSAPGGVTPPTSSATVTVGAPSLSVTKTRSSDSTAVAGENVNWLVTVTNSGNATASPVTVVDTWTAGAFSFSRALRARRMRPPRQARPSRSRRWRAGRARAS